MTDALRDAVLQLVEHVASEMRRNDPERHRNQSRIPNIGEAVATANYHAEAVHHILSALAPLSVLRGHVEYAGSDADARSEFKDTALAPMQTELQSSLTLDPCEFKVGRLFAYIRSLGIPENRRGGGVDAIGTCVLEN